VRSGEEMPVGKIYPQPCPALGWGNPAGPFVFLHPSLVLRTRHHVLCSRKCHKMGIKTKTSLYQKYEKVKE
jgi:hypothetical protein